MSRTDAPPADLLALDVGGTKLAAAVVSDEGEVRARATCPTEAPDGAALLALAADLLEEVRTAAGTDVQALGVGCGGPMTPGGATVSPLNIPQWRGFPLRDELVARTGLPVFVDNDAKALALGEGWCGAAAGRDNFLAMVVSTGVGGGIVLDGRLLDGAASNAGHIGHLVVDPLGHRCPCGARGCLEAECSGRSIERHTGRPAAEAPVEVRVRTGRLVGRAVASVVALLDLPLAVVAGSVALGFGDDFFDAAQHELDRCTGLEFTRGARIVPAGLGADGPLVGAAAVARRALLDGAGR